MTANETWQAGDVAAFAHITANATGHVGFIVEMGGAITNISAHKKDVSSDSSQFTSFANSTFRRYVGK